MWSSSGWEHSIFSRGFNEFLALKGVLIRGGALNGDGGLKEHLRWFTQRCQKGSNPTWKSDNGHVVK